MAPYVNENSAFPMKGGVGDDSYAANSQVQASGVQFVHPILHESIQNMNLPNEPTVRIADLGCSCGPNSVDHMNLIVDTLRDRYASSTCCTSSSGYSEREFLVSFSDLPANDFNSLFRILESDVYVKSRKPFDVIKPRHYAKRNFFAAGVPGSFYGRVFPRASIHIAFCSFALHWLSKIPESVQRIDSPSWNNGRIWIQGGKRAVADAYAKQSESDLRSFLKARAEEMVKGGLVFLIMKGRSDPDPTLQYDPKDMSMFGTSMQRVWDEMVSENLISAEKRSTFNIPLYFPTVQELRHAIEYNSEFHIERLDFLHNVLANKTTDESNSTPETSGKKVAKMCRSLLGGSLESHLGCELTEEFFGRLEKIAIERSRREWRSKSMKYMQVNVAVLIRK